MTLTLSSSPPRPMPYEPVLFAQQLTMNETGPTFGAELLNGVSTPTLSGDPSEVIWLAIEVWSMTGGEAGERHPENVELSVKQNKKTQTFKAKQKTDYDTELTPFLVPVTACGLMELTAKVGKRISPVAKLAVPCT
ncbi:MAG: hypothetical protein QM817_38505 [Archangium sp.]